LYILFILTRTQCSYGIVLGDREQGEKKRSGEREDSASKDKAGNVTRSIQYYLIIP
jgi:hypothetical protein